MRHPLRTMVHLTKSINSNEHMILSTSNSPYCNLANPIALDDPCPFLIPQTVMNYDCNDCGGVFRRRGDLSKHHRRGCCPHRSTIALQNFSTQNQNAFGRDDGVREDTDIGSPESDQHMSDDESPEPPLSQHDNVVLDTSDGDDSDEICEDEECADPVQLINLPVITAAKNNQTRPQDSSDSEEDAMGDLAVNYTQFVSARYILTTGASDIGLSISGTDEFLETQPQGGDVRLKWGNGRLFWNDHARRQRMVLPSVGKWSKTEIEAPHIKIPYYCAWVRDFPRTITQVISVARYVRVPNLDCSKELILDASIQTNAIGQRIVHTFQSADDLNYLICALRLKEKHRQTTFVPLQLFIDRANVTQLNKRSMYPVCGVTGSGCNRDW